MLTQQRPDDVSVHTTGYTMIETVCDSHCQGQTTVAHRVKVLSVCKQKRSQKKHTDTHSHTHTHTHTHAQIHTHTLRCHIPHASEHVQTYRKHIETHKQQYHTHTHTFSSLPFQNFQIPLPRHGAQTQDR